MAMRLHRRSQEEENPMEDAFTTEEIRELRQLLEIEKIRKVKLLYSQLMDSRDIDALGDIFAEDAVCEFGPYGTWHGREQIRENYHGVFKDEIPYGGFHATTNQWVELTGPDTAVSRTYLIDIIHEADPRTNPVIWYGLYDEDYRKVDGHWKIQRCSLQFLWPKRLVTENWPGPFPGTTGHGLSA
jgi:ketosteroid isomerase-like protein